MRNHFVPQAYLRAWAEDGDYIVAYPTARDAAFIKPNTKNIGQETGLYPDDLESALNREIETPMGPIIHRINAGGSVQEEDKQIVANYFRSLIDRSPMARELVTSRVPEAAAEIHQKLDAALDKLLVAGADAISIKRRRAEIAEACRKAGGTSDAIWHMALRPGRESATTNMIASMNMAVFSAPPTKHFFTSDRPAMRPLRGIYGGRDAFLLPLGPHKVLAISMASLQNFTMTNQDVSMINMRLSAEADRWVITSRAESWIRRFIDKHRNHAGHPSTKASLDTASPP